MFKTIWKLFVGRGGNRERNGLIFKTRELFRTKVNKVNREIERTGRELSVLGFF